MIEKVGAASYNYNAQDIGANNSDGKKEDVY